MSKTEIKVGQKWKNHLGDIVTVETNNNASLYKFKVVSEFGSWYTVTSSGDYYDDNTFHGRDLAVLIQDVIEPQSTEGKMQEELSEKKYSKEDIVQAFKALRREDIPCYEKVLVDFDNLMSMLEKQSDPEYQEYLRLKEKFKNR